jgi:L-fuculose-phosphate aldolase|tara:strand:- start:190 stop:942 length:753 start_codon:yes stop_codon:yes gene_type:complete
MSKPEPTTPDPQYNWTPGADPKTEKEIEEFFNSREIEELKVLMCDIGRRMWQKNYVDGNGGNLTIRVGDDLVLCTPTLISKGFMKPEDMCLVNLEGEQLAGTLKRTGEVLTHIGIMKLQPNAKACCHAHPPLATGFAIAAVTPERCLTPEGEVFIGEIGIADFRWPGSPECAKVVGESGIDHVAIFMSNHGVITRAKHIEMAYWRLENLETVCSNHLITKQIMGNAAIPKIDGEDADKLFANHKTISETM